MSSSIFDMNESGLFPKGVGEPVAGTGILYDFQKNNSLVKDQFASTIPLVEEIRKMTIPQKSGQILPELRMDQIFLPTIFEKLSLYKENIGKGIVQDRDSLFTEPEKMYLGTLPKDKSELQQLISRAQKAGLDLGESFIPEPVVSETVVDMGKSMGESMGEAFSNLTLGEIKTIKDMIKTVKENKGISWEEKFNMSSEQEIKDSIENFDILAQVDAIGYKKKDFDQVFEFLKETGTISEDAERDSGKDFLIRNRVGAPQYTNWNKTMKWMREHKDRYFVPGLKTAFQPNYRVEKLSKSGFAEEKGEREQLQKQLKETKKK
jgi:hypothetical protein